MGQYPMHSDRALATASPCLGENHKVSAVCQAHDFDEWGQCFEKNKPDGIDADVHHFGIGSAELYRKTDG